MWAREQMLVAFALHVSAAFHASAEEHAVMAPLASALARLTEDAKTLEKLGRRGTSAAVAPALTPELEASTVMLLASPWVTSQLITPVKAEAYRKMKGMIGR